MTPQTAYALGTLASIAPTGLLIWAAHDLFRLLSERGKDHLRANAEQAEMREKLREDWLAVEAEHLENRRAELAAQFRSAPANQARAAIAPRLQETTRRALELAVGKAA